RRRRRAAARVARPVRRDGRARAPALGGRPARPRGPAPPVLSARGAAPAVRNEDDRVGTRGYRRPVHDVPPLIEARVLVKRFGDFTAVDGIDVEVRPGEAFGFLGPNGAGKSSTMRMIGCVSPPTDGHLRVLG